MPAAMLKALAKKSKKTFKDLERYWKEAKTEAEQKGFKHNQDEFWKYVVAIVERRAGLRSGPARLKEDIDNDQLEDAFAELLGTWLQLADDDELDDEAEYTYDVAAGDQNLYCWWADGEEETVVAIDIDEAQSFYDRWEPFGSTDELLAAFGTLIDDWAD